MFHLHPRLAYTKIGIVWYYATHNTLFVMVVGNPIEAFKPLNTCK